MVIHMGWFGTKILGNEGRYTSGSPGLDIDQITTGGITLQCLDSRGLSKRKVHDCHHGHTNIG